MFYGNIDMLSINDYNAVQIVFCSDFLTVSSLL